MSIAERTERPSTSAGQATHGACRTVNGERICSATVHPLLGFYAIRYAKISFPSSLLVACIPVEMFSGQRSIIVQTVGEEYLVEVGISVFESR